MKRTFNITGTCIPARHFVADVSGKVARVMDMITRGDYFTINRPRQYGKTKRKVVLMVDEVDKSSNNQLFLDFLGMLRTEYLGRNQGKEIYAAWV